MIYDRWMDISKYAFDTQPIKKKTKNEYGNNDILQHIKGQILKFGFGYRHAGCITKSGKVYMWGDNKYGQLGIGNTESKPIPTLIPKRYFNNEKVVDIVLGGWHSGAITETGKLYIWGCNDCGQLGIGNNIDAHKPTLLPSEYFNGEKPKQLCLGYRHSGIITESGQVYTWGRNEHGQLGVHDKTDRNTPTLIPQNEFNNMAVAQLAMGAHHTGAITENGVLYMWGWNCTYQLGCSLSKEIEYPYTTTKYNLNNKKIIKISLGEVHTGVITEDGDLYLWGNNQNKEIGIDTPGKRGFWNPDIIEKPLLMSKEIFDGEKIIDVSLGDEYTKVLTENYRIFICGWGEYWHEWK